MMDGKNPAAMRMRVHALRLLFLVGVCIMAYPFASNAWYQWQANSQLDSLDAAVEKGSADEYAKELDRAHAYNERLVGEVVPNVFAIREGTVDKEYEGFLNVQGNLLMGEIDIPVIQARLPIYHYSTEESLAKGCGHIFGSSLPVGGESTHAVITAHRGLPSAKLFTDLDEMQKGDRFYITVLDQTLAYEVDEIEVVAPAETRSLAIQKGKDLVTLVTCTPYGTNTNRLLVHGHRVPYDGPGEMEGVAPHPWFILKILLQLACIAVGVGVALGLHKIVGWRSRRKAEAGDGDG